MSDQTILTRRVKRNIGDVRSPLGGVDRSNDPETVNDVEHRIHLPTWPRIAITEGAAFGQISPMQAWTYRAQRWMARAASGQRTVRSSDVRGVL
jgi:hypothetical protein